MILAGCIGVLFLVHLQPPSHTGKSGMTWGELSGTSLKFVLVLFHHQVFYTIPFGVSVLLSLSLPTYSDHHQARSATSDRTIRELRGQPSTAKHKEDPRFLLDEGLLQCSLTTAKPLPIPQDFLNTWTQSSVTQRAYFFLRKQVPKQKQTNKQTNLFNLWHTNYNLVLHFSEPWNFRGINSERKRIIYCKRGLEMYSLKNH